MPRRRRRLGMALGDRLPTPCQGAIPDPCFLESQMPPPTLARWHVQLLGEVYALATRGDAQRDPPVDRTCILALFSLVRPGKVEVVIAQALERLYERDLPAARDQLEKADATHPGNAMIKAL